MGSGSWGRVGASGAVSRAAAVALVLLAAVTGCGGGGSSATPASGRAPAHGGPPARSGAPPAGVVGDRGALGAPPPPSAAHSRFVRRADAACRTVAVQIAAAGGTLDPRRRAQLLLAERQRLQTLDAALRAIRAPREDAAELAAYRDVLHAQAVLDEIVARGLLAGGDGSDPGVEAGERQNDFNRTARTRIARRLGLSACLRDPA
jgi:hypothetical protein